MREPITLTDENLDAVLNTDKPTLILVTNGDGLRGDFKVAFNKQADEDPKVVYARLDPSKNPAAAARFSAGEKPLLVGWYCGEEVVRRPRPWGTDLPLAIEALQATVRQNNPQQIEESEKQVEEKVAVLDSPVTVTDATFEQEVLNSDIPVLVDFWAPWCGPCRMVAPVLDKLSKEFAGQIKVAKVNTDENPGLSQAFRIMSIPNLMVVKQRTIIFNQPGALPEAALRNLITQAIALEIPPKEQPAPQQ
jgi:thioredoxin 1